MKKRGFGEGRWNGVGGKLEAGESIEEGLVRECKEEIEVIAQHYEKVAEIIFDEQHQESHQLMQVHVFICSKWQGTPSETEEMRPQWFKIEDIPYEDMWADDPHWLPQVLDGKKLKCAFKLDENDQITEKTISVVKSF